MFKTQLTTAYVFKKRHFLMSDFMNWIKRLFSKDPAIRHAKQIKQGNIKLVALKDDRLITALRYSQSTLKVLRC